VFLTLEVCILDLCTKFEADSLIRSKVIRGSRNFEIRSHDPGHAHLVGHFVIHTQKGCVFHLCTKFKADSFIHSKVIRGSHNFEIGSRDHGHAHLGGHFVIRTQEGSSSISVPMLKRLVNSFKGYKGVPKLEIGLRDPGHPRPFRGRFMVPIREGSVLYVYTEFEADSSIRSKVIRGV